MQIHDDADGATITRETVAALNKSAHFVGKLGPSFTKEELEEIEGAIRLLQSTVDLKKRMNNADRT